MPSALPNIQQIADRLYLRRTEGMLVEFKDVSTADWKPAERECHANVDYWCERNADLRPVRGWLYFDFRPVLPFVRFNTHSVVEDKHGNLIDITPAGVFQRYPFIRAEEDEETFAALVDVHNVRVIEYVP